MNWSFGGFSGCKVGPKLPSGQGSEYDCGMVGKRKFTIENWSCPLWDRVQSLAAVGYGRWGEIGDIFATVNGGNRIISMF